jgi:hypothetical protein
VKIRFKAHKDSADALILGLAKSGIPVVAECEEARMVKLGDVYITADFPMLTTNAMPVADTEMMLYSDGSKTVSEEERTFF